MRKLLTPEEFNAISRLPKRDILAILEQFVKRTDRGRPMLGDEPLTAYQRVKRHREKVRQGETPTNRTPDGHGP